MIRLPHRTLLAAALLLLAAAPARADIIYWQFSWHRDPIAVPADDPGTGGVSFTNEVNRLAANSSDVVATNLRVFSSAPANNPDYLGVNGAYTLTMTLKDDSSGETGTLTFSGKLSGEFSIASANITNAFTGPTTQSLTLGGNDYEVTIGPYSPPGPPTASNAGSIGAHVDVNGGIDVRDVPEPSALALCGIGAALIGFVTWRRIRRAPPLAA